MTILVLWDIDGTLIRGGPAGARAFSTAVEKVLGRHPGDHGVIMSGKTDTLIALEILATMEVVDDHAQELLPDVLDALARALLDDRESLTQHGRVLVGVMEAVATLARRDDVVQTLLTGNIARNAFTKLDAFALTDSLNLHLGAYGDDHRDRDELVPIALRRVKDQLAIDITPADTWVIGDTPRDLSCARAAGARFVLVATGHFPTAALHELGADAVFDDLSDTSAFLAALGLASA